MYIKLKSFLLGHLDRSAFLRQKFSSFSEFLCKFKCVEAMHNFHLNFCTKHLET